MRILDDDGAELRKPTKDDFGLKKAVGLGNMIIINEKGIPMRFNSYKAFVEAFIVWRLPLYEKARQHSLSKLKNKLREETSKRDFLNAVHSKKLLLVDTKGDYRLKEDVERDISDLKLDKKYYKLGMDKLTRESINKIESNIKVIENQIKDIENTSSKQIWITKLTAFAHDYIKIYGDDRPERNN